MTNEIDKLEIDNEIKVEHVKKIDSLIESLKYYLFAFMFNISHDFSCHAYFFGEKRG